jgi:uncharacterized membrane protein
MLWKYIAVFLVSMVPIVELRGAIPIAIGYDIPPLVAYIICVIGNMIPVPFIYLFARKFLIWGSDKRFIGRFFRFCVRKGEKAGEKLTSSAGKRGGLVIALMLFVGIPIPGTGAWTGTLAASFLNMGAKETTIAVSTGVVVAGVIMGLASAGVFAAIGF